MDRSVLLSPPSDVFDRGRIAPRHLLVLIASLVKAERNEVSAPELRPESEVRAVDIAVATRRRLSDPLLRFR